MVSAWSPTPEELAALNASGTIQLRMAGTNHLVVALGVAEPPARTEGNRSPIDGNQQEVNE
jgi:hypothetical protein